MDTSMESEARMSKRKMQRRHREVKEIVSDWISLALEEAVERKELTRSEADYWYRRLSSCGLPELKFILEPSFGKPYYMPEPTPDPETLKAQIRRRLYEANLNRLTNGATYEVGVDLAEEAGTNHPEVLH